MGELLGVGQCRLGASTMEKLYLGTGNRPLPIAQLSPLPLGQTMTLISTEGIWEENRRRRRKPLLKSPAALVQSWIPVPLLQY